ncbi:GGDEF domain-containing protein [Hydrogenimonas urashimensis]|uniref:GGDEF domain-containing protein n=1 Tax=Hydrogenimonas urashimensis TaxID=2740515 RepID=UPI001915A6C5|nr:GGDEF domain-containing protein [Hydrogenimonas urashimensis]
MRKNKYTLPPPLPKTGDTAETENEYSEERRQAVTRLLFIVILVPILAWLTPERKIALHPFWSGIVLYIVLAFVHFRLLANAPERFRRARKIFVIFLDIAVTSLLVATLKETGFLFSLLYIWVILGNGMRFGPKYLYVAMGFVLMALAGLYLFVPYWHTHTIFMLYLALATLILPLFMLRLIYRIERNRLQLKAILNNMEYNAMHDSLTELGNRFAFDSRLRESLALRTPFAMMFIDLDGFKQVNDRFGHGVGDRVLKEVAGRLERFASRNDLSVFRLGGDEFAVLVPGVAPDVLDRLAGTLLHALSQPYAEGKIGAISASIGISRCPLDSENASDLKKFADMAMYLAKQSGKNRYQLYDRRTFRVASDQT